MRMSVKLCVNAIGLSKDLAEILSRCDPQTFSELLKQNWNKEDLRFTIGHVGHAAARVERVLRICSKKTVFNQPMRQKIKKTKPTANMQDPTSIGIAIAGWALVH